MVDVVAVAVDGVAIVEIGTVDGGPEVGVGALVAGGEDTSVDLEHAARPPAARAPSASWINVRRSMRASRAIGWIGSFGGFRLDTATKCTAPGTIHPAAATSTAMNPTRWTALAVAAVVVLASCGDDDGSGATITDPIVSDTTALVTTVPAPVSLPTAFDPWVRMPAAGQTVAAAYVTLVNDSDSDIALLDVSSPVGLAELHETVADADGVMRMQHRPEGFVVPANGELVMAPGGAHVMLFDVDVLELATVGAAVLEFDFGPLGTLEVRAEVRGEMPPSNGSGHGDTGHGEMGDGETGHGDTDHGEGSMPGTDPDPADLDVNALHDLDDELHMGVYEPERQREFVARFRAALMASDLGEQHDLDPLLAALDELDAALDAGDVERAAAAAFLSHDLAHAFIPH